MTKAWLALSLTFLCVGALAAPADALESYYNCFDKPPNQWCDGKANGTFDGLHSWDYNEGWNPGIGSFVVCERVYRPATGNSLQPVLCSLQFVSYYYGQVQCVCYEAEVKHQASTNRSVHGYANSNF